MDSETVKLAKVGNADALYQMALMGLQLSLYDERENWDSESEKIANNRGEYLDDLISISSIEVFYQAVEKSLELISFYKEYYKQRLQQLKDNSSTGEEKCEIKRELLKGLRREVFKILAIPLLFKAAELDQPEAQYLLGELYSYDNDIKNYFHNSERIRSIVKRFDKTDDKKIFASCGIQDNLDLAYKWFFKAAGQGHVMAQYMVGQFLLYVKHSNDMNDYKIAADYLIKSGEDKRETYLRIGQILLRQVNRNIETFKNAKLFYNRGLEEEILRSENLAKTYYDIGNYYLKGEIETADNNSAYLFYTDYKEAIKYLTKAAELGYFYAIRDLGHLYYYGESANTDAINCLNYSEMEEFGLLTHFPSNNKSAIEWYTKLIEKGKGVQFPSDFFGYSEEYDLFTGIAEAKENLGYIYIYGGDGIEKDDNKAAEWFFSACDMASKDFSGTLDYLTLADYYFHGYHDIPQDYRRSFECYSRASFLSNDKELSGFSLYKLGEMYLNGYGVEKDDTLAAKCFQRAADEGYSDAAGKLSWMYSHGIGVNKNESLAVDYDRKRKETKDDFNSYYNSTHRLRDGIFEGPDGIYYDEDGNSVDDEYAFEDDY